MDKSINEAVRDSYGSVARQGLGSHQEGIKGIANAFGYSEDELSSIPDEANMGLSCGNPVAIASIREGETVVDLGSGGGLDVFLASKLVGKRGPGHRCGYDWRYDFPGAQECSQRRLQQCKVPPRRN